MRVLLLCAATLAAGFLAGTLYAPEQDLRPMRSGDGSDTRRTYEYVPSDDQRSEGGTGASTPGAAKLSAEAVADVRALAKEASEALAQIQTGETGAALENADGEITGTVVDPSGEPVAGVVITAIPDTRPVDLYANARKSRETPHNNRALGQVAQEAIQNELWRRLARRTAESGENGRYKIEGLIDSNHTVTAYHPDFQVKPLNQRGRVRPDAAVEFVATPVAETRVEVRLPDGTPAENATLRWQGAHGRGRENWLPTARTVRLPVGRCKVKAQVWLPVPLESKEIEWDVAARDSATGDDGAGEDGGRTLVLQLIARKVLTAILKLPAEFAAPRSVEYRMRSVDEGDVDPMSLLKDQSNRHAYSPTPSRAYWYDLEPGRYLVAAFLNKRRLIAHAVAEVGEGSSEVELPVEEPGPGTYVKAKLIGPDGGPVPGNVSFRVVTEPDGRARTHRVDAMQQGDTWLVLLDGVPSAIAKKSPDAVLRVGTRDFGGATKNFRLRGGNLVTFRFDKPAKLEVKLEGYVGSGVEGSLYVALRSKLGADGWRLVSPDGTCTLGNVQPGTYDLYLYVRKDNRNYPILKRSLGLRAGADKISVTMPRLHTLKARWTGKGRASRAILRSSDPTLGSLRRDGRLSNKVVTFDGLAQGTYVIEINRKRRTVQVPGAPEVTVR